MNARSAERITGSSFCADSGRARDPGPFVDLRLDERGELLGTAADGLRAVRGQTLHDLGCTQGAHDLAVQPLDDVARGSGRRENSVPLGRIVTWKPGFGYRRNLGQALAS